MSAGPLLRDARIARGLSLRAAARQLGVNASTLSLTERDGDNHMGTEALIRAARFYGMDVDAVLAADGRIAPDVVGILLADVGWWRVVREAKARGIDGWELLQRIERSRRRTR